MSTGGSGITYASTYDTDISNQTPATLDTSYGLTNPVVYAIQAYGGFSTSQSFARITKLAETIISQFDTTGSLEILFDVRVFNALLGIQKDASNLNIYNHTTDYYDMSTNLFRNDSITITPGAFINCLNNDYTNIIDMGHLRTVYSDFALYVANYFGLATPTSTYTGIATFFANDYGFNPNGGVFDASAFLNIIVAQPLNADTGAYIADLSGAIVIGGVTQLLRNAVDANPFGNRDPINGTTASDPNDRSNYGVTDGFFCDDLIFIPKDGFSVTMNLAVDNNIFGPGLVSASSAAADTKFGSHSTSTSTFVETSTTTTMLVSRTTTVPLLIRLVNLSDVAVQVEAQATSATSSAVTLLFSGIFNFLIISRNGVVLADHVHIFSFVDYTVASSTTYTYTVTPVGHKGVKGSPVNVVVTTLVSGTWTNLGAGLLGTGETNVSALYYNPVTKTLYVGGQFAANYNNVAYTSAVGTSGIIGNNWHSIANDITGGTGWNDVGNSPGSYVTSITQVGNTLYVGGYYVVNPNHYSITQSVSGGPLTTVPASGNTRGDVFTALSANNRLYVGSTYAVQLVNGAWDSAFAAHANFINGGGTIQALAYNTVTHTLYAAGTFNHYNNGNNDGFNYVAQTVNNGAWTQSGAGVNNQAYSLYSDNANGVVYVGGGFTSDGVVTSPGVACNIQNGGWETLGAGLVNGIVYTMDMDINTGILYLGGAFTAIGGGAPARYIARCNFGHYTQVGNGLNGAVKRLSFDSCANTLYLAGNFTADGSGNAMEHVASIYLPNCLDPTLLTWNNLGFGIMDNRAGYYGIQAIFYHPATRTVYAGGDLSPQQLNSNVLSYTPSSKNYVVRCVNGSLWHQVGNGAPDVTTSFAYDSNTNTLFMGGKYNTVYKSVNNGALQNVVSTTLNGTVNTILYKNSVVYAAGEFTSDANGTTVTQVAYVNGSGAWTAYGNGFFNTSDVVYCMAYDDDTDTMYVGGSFTMNLTGTILNNVAKYVNGVWTPIDLGLSGIVRALYYVTETQTLYAGGDFTVDGHGKTMMHVAMSVAGGPWQQVAGGLGFGNGLPSNVTVLSLEYNHVAGALYAGGSFTGAGDDKYRSIKAVAYSVLNGPWSQVGVGLNSDVKSLSYDPIGNRLFAGGYFTVDGTGNPMVHVAIALSP